MKWKEIETVEGVRYFEVHGLSGEMEHVCFDANALAYWKGEYDLETEEATIEHIMFEHFLRRNPERHVEIPAHIKPRLKGMS